MHCNEEGCIKHLLKLWFSTIHLLAFYLQHQIHIINSILKKVKYPKEIQRGQNSITQAIFHYHANEFRAVSSYSLIYIMKGQFINPRYHNHLVMFILFLSFIRQDLVSENDNRIAQILINEFIIYNSKHNYN